MFPVVVLAGGLATRLRPITENIPKSLIEVNNEPFVIHQLRLFESKGITKVHFCLGFLGGMVEEIIKSINWKIDITFSHDGDKLLGTGGAINKALKYLPEKFFVTYGDSYLDINYEDVSNFYEIHNQNKNQGLMTIFRNEGKWDSSNVIYENNRIITYTKKYKNEKMNYIDFGLGVLTKNHFKSYTFITPFDLSEIYEKAAQQQTLLGFEVYKRFYEIGSFSGIQELSDYLTK